MKYLAVLIVAPGERLLLNVLIQHPKASHVIIIFQFDVDFLDWRVVSLVLFILRIILMVREGRLTVIYHEWRMNIVLLQYMIYFVRM